MGYKIVKPDEVKDYYADSDVPGEFRRLTDALEAKQLAATLIRIPAHSDFEQGTGHSHKEIEEIYLITRGVLTMRFGDKVTKVKAPAAVKIDAETRRSHRNEGNELVEIWAISPKIDHDDSVFIKKFWPASPKARQKR